MDNVLILLSVLYHCLNYLPSNVQCNILTEEGQTLSKESILTTLCEKFSVKQHEHANSFIESTSKIILQIANSDNKENANIGGIFNFENLPSNCKLFDNLYQSVHSNEEIDERMFLNNDTRPLSPYMVSPFQSQRQTNVCVNTPRKPSDGFQIAQAHNSKRILNYENISTPTESVVKEFNSLADYQKVITMRKMMMSPYTPTPIAATPITRAMENNNWCGEYTNKMKSYDQNNLPPSIIKYLAKYSGANFEARKNTLANGISKCIDKVSQFTKRAKMILQFFLRTIDELWSLEERSQSSDIKPLIENEEFYHSVFVASAESIFYINNETVLSIEKLLELYELTSFSFWKIINCFIRIDPSVNS